MNNFLKGSNSKFVVNLFKTFGIACSLVAVQACNENPNNNDKNGEKGGASSGNKNGKNTSGQPGEEDTDEYGADAADGEGTGNNKNNKNGQTGNNNSSGSGTGKNGGNSENGSGTGSGNGGESGTGDGTGNGGSNPGGGNGDATDADALKKQKIANKIAEIDKSATWTDLKKFVGEIINDSELQVEDVFNKIKEKIGGKVYCGNTVLDFTIDDNAKLIEFLNFCASVEKVFHKNEDYFKFYFEAGNDVNIFIDGTDKFNLNNLESLVTIENKDGEGLELDDQGIIKLLGKEWNSGKNIDKIVEFLEGISKMNLGSNFKGLEVKAENDGMFSIDGFLFKIFEPDDSNNYICKPDVLNKGIDVLDKLGKLKKVINNFFKDLEVAQGDFSTDLSSNNAFLFGNFALSLKFYFSNNVDACKNFFAALYPDKKYYVKDESGNAEIYRNDGTNYNKVGVLKG